MNVRLWCCVGLGFAVVMASVSVPGCGPGGPPPPKRFKVSGTATLDGQPLEDGWIKLVDTSPKAAMADAGKIKGGKFSLETTPGEKRVEITASKEGTKNIEGKEGIKEQISLVPEKYNTKSELKETVKETANEFKFDLKSK